MEDLEIPVAPVLPVGYLEWAQVGPTLYGVDSIGQTFILRPVIAATGQQRGAARLFANLLGISTGAARPRYRRGRGE